MENKCAHTITQTPVSIQSVSVKVECLKTNQVLFCVCLFTKCIVYIVPKTDQHDCSNVWTADLLSQIAPEHPAIRAKNFTPSNRTIIGVQLQCDLIPLAIELLSYARGENTLRGLPLDGFYLEVIYQSKCFGIGWGNSLKWAEALTRKSLCFKAMRNLKLLNIQFSHGCECYVIHIPKRINF